MMETLNAFYVNFKVDLDNQLVVKLWYQTFENIGDEIFKQLVESYCKSNIYPPQSPTHLIQHMKDLVLSNELSAEEAWEIGYAMVKRFYFSVTRACEELKKNGEENIANALNEMRSRFNNLMTDDLPYVRKDFIEIYKRVVTQNINQKVMIGDVSQLKLGEGK